MSLPKRLLIFLAALALAGPVHAQGTMRVGMNLNWTLWYELDGRYSDETIVLPWVAAGAPVTSGAPPVGAIRNAIVTTYPGARTLKASGKGTLSVYFPAGVKDAGNLVKTASPNLFLAPFTGKEVYTFTPVTGKGNRVGLTVQATDATTPIGSVQVLAPGASQGLYHPNFLAGLAPFAVLRTMDPQQITNSKEVHWADRNTQYGQDLEAMISLANQLGRDLWICVPHRAVAANGAPTDWCYSLGDLLNACCDPNRTIYLEYSDEVWNWGPSWAGETAYVFAMGALDYEFIGARQAYARAAHRAFQAVSSRIGPYGPKLKRVFAGQLGNTATIDPSLPWAVAKGYRFDSLAGGIYWSMLGDPAAIKAAWAAGDQAGAMKLIDDGYRAGAQQTIAWVKQYAAYSQRYGMELVGYEGGPAGGALWSDQAGLPIMKAYVKSMLCKQQHLDTFAALDAAGVSLLCYYSYCHIDPTWSSRLTADDLSNGRYRGLLHHVVGAPPALFAGSDSTTQGNWPGAYGSLGATIAGAPPAIPPPGVTPVPGSNVGGKLLTYQVSTADVRAPQLPDGSGNRVAAIWYDQASLTIDVPGPATGGQYLLSLYCLDWSTHDGYAQTVTILDADSGTVLDTRSASRLTTTPVYLRWAVEGHVKVQVTRTGGYACAVSGVFLDPVPSP